MNALIATSVASMVDQFLKPSIKTLQELGYQVTVACNFEDCGTISRERCESLKLYLEENNVKYLQVEFPRNPLKISRISKSYKKLRSILQSKEYSLCHCHSPIGGFVTRLACKEFRGNGLKVIYTAHGFHFYKGAPFINWLLYYPVEKMCSRWTDVLITINKEDYERARKKFKACKVEYIPGVGIDVDKLKNTIINKSDKRREIGVPESAFMLLSVGELNANKNHKVIIEALARIQNPNIHYCIAGTGELKHYLQKLAEQKGLTHQVHLLGYRNDVNDLYKAADVDVFPSIREGLGLAAVEGMSAGLPLICSDNRGTRSYAINYKNSIICKYNDVIEFEKAILFLDNDRETAREFGLFGQSTSLNYSIKMVNNELERLYMQISR